VLVLAALALAVSQDGLMDVPPPGPIPTELAATFAGAVRRNPGFAAVAGRTIQPGMLGILAPGAEWPAWIVEIHWKEKGRLRAGVAMLMDVPAMDKVRPGTEKIIPLEMREGPWIAAKVFEDLTFESWAEQSREQRRANNEAMTVGAIQMLISSEAAFSSESGSNGVSGSYGEFRCLSQPAACLPGSKAPALIGADYVPAERHGYRRTFHPGAAVKGKGRQTGLIATWAYTAVPMDPKYGRRSFCGDFTGTVCAVAGATMPPVTGGACPKSCQPVP
jgi:hypothetical protein